MASYQDLETKLAVLSDRLDFVMKMSRVPLVMSRLDPTPVPVSLWDLYLASKGAGLTPKTTEEAIKTIEAAPKLVESDNG